MADLTKAFTGLSSDTNAVIEDLLQLIYRAGEFQDEHYDMLDAWRNARGDRAMDAWRWWIGGPDDDELYEDEFASEMEALAAGDRRYADEGKFRIVEARGWADSVEDGADEIGFAATRNARVVEVKGVANG